LRTTTLADLCRPVRATSSRPRFHSIAPA
jgi:hypothetical protein